MRTWIRFFVGTPQRFLYTLLGLAIVAVLAKPGLLTMTFNRLMAEVQPILAPLINFGVTVAIIIIMLRVAFNIGKGGK
jgi:hypothetical protein